MRTSNHKRPSLKHLCPDTHTEAEFAQYIQCIPKLPEQHREQADHIKTLVESGWRKVGRILDIGAGEGTFLKLVLQLLQDNGALADDLTVSVIEKEDTLWRKCHTLLQSDRIRCERIQIDTNTRSTVKLPSDRVALIRSIDALKKTAGDGYDLIIASHVAYYFDNAGFDLAYALISRLLKPQGYAWFVIRDRDCPFYRCRDGFLAAASLPDIHRECFSDSFLDRVRCLIDNSPGTRPIMEQKRTLSLSSDENREGLVSYLMWLSGLTESQVNEACSVAAQEGFSETHIWIPSIAPIDRVRELHTLSEVDIIGRCIDFVRRVAPDIQTHRAFLATVQPTGSVRVPNRIEAADIERPSPFSEFKVWSVGYECRPEGYQGSNLLRDFFTKNTSFLFYSRFFHDDGFQCQNSQGSWADYALISRLEGTPKYDTPAAYPYRFVDVGTPVRYPQSLGVEGGDVTVAPATTFSASHEDWGQRQAECYCKKASPNPGSPQLWSVSVACNLLPDFRGAISADQYLNACCALFLTVSTSHDLKQLAPYFVGQTKARLAQWLAEDLYHLLQDRMDELQKQARMLELMSRPLRQISEALSTMQSDTQELRALMFEPEESLFASFAEIEPFFLEGNPLPIEMAGQDRITVRHTPGDYSQDELPIVLACVLCAIFGKLNDLKGLRRRQLILAKSAVVLDDASENAATRRLAEDLKCLIGLTDSSGTGPEPTLTLASVLSTASHDTRITALARIKAALFSPFKAGVPTWDPIAFTLLRRHSKFSRALLLGKLAESGARLQLPTTPVGYATVLAFVRDVTVALTKLGSQTGDFKRYLESLEWTEQASSVGCTMRFNSPVADGSDGGINVSALAKCLKDVSALPREWRIVDANYGDTTRPFVYLVNKVLGLGASWKTIEPTSPEVFVIKHAEMENQVVLFSVVCEKQQVSLIWKVEEAANEDIPR